LADGAVLIVLPLGFSNLPPLVERCAEEMAHVYRILAKSSSLFWHYACDSNPSQPVRPSEFAHSHLHRIVWQKGNQQCRVFHPYKKNYSPTIKECQKYFGTTHPLTRCPRLLEFARSGFADKVMWALCNQCIVDCVDALRATK
jgi:hypothetical protein